MLPEYGATALETKTKQNESWGTESLKIVKMILELWNQSLSNFEQIESKNCAVSVFWIDFDPGENIVKICLIECLFKVMIKH